jgi:16S rRNA (guanine(966)-N(2))-methyltransferase RsmD
LAGGSVLDLFAGTGALGIEALSRGMDRSVFIENNPRVMNILQKNITACDLENRTETLKCTVSKGLSILRLREDRFEIVFLDPPYRKKLIGKTLGEISNAHLLKKDGLVIAEHASNEAVEATYGTLKLDDQRQYGETAVSFFIQ